jgi:molecular chaperone DnaK (HSP70)
VARITDSGARVVPGSVQTLRVGGLDFDEAVRRHADRALDGALTLTATRRPEAREPIRRACENAKHRLSVAKRTELSITLPAGPRRVRLNRNELETLIRDDVGVVLAQLRRAVRGAGLGQRDLAAVVLTGGSARVPLLGRALREGLRRPVRGCENPDGALAFGAAVAGA